MTIGIGGIDGARATEQLMPLRMRLCAAAGHADYNWRIAGFRVATRETTQVPQAAEVSG